MIALHPAVARIPSAGDVDAWVAALNAARVVRDLAEAYCLSGTALTRAYADGAVATFHSIRGLVDTALHDPLSLSSLLDSLMTRAAWLEDLPLAVALDGWSVEPTEIASSAGPSADVVPVLAIASSWLSEGAASMCCVGHGRAARFSGMTGTLVADSYSGPPPPDLDVQLIPNPRAAYLRDSVSINSVTQHSARGALASLCDDSCFDRHSDRVRIHPAFDRSSGASSADPSVLRTALRLAARMIHSGPRSVSRPLRIGSKSTSPVRVSARHGGEARRAHVTDRGAAYRLHAWALTDGTVELASVEPKAYTDIPD